jgi:hypothetical protein
MEDITNDSKYLITDSGTVSRGKDPTDEIPNRHMLAVHQVMLALKVHEIATAVTARSG